MRIASLSLVTALNLFLRRKLPREVFDHLQDREVAIEVSGTPIRLSFRVRGGHFVPIRPTPAPHVRFRASLRDFMLLVAREEDADTLYFNRRLVVEGDTEAGLLVKNSLDALELPRTRKVLRRVLGLSSARH